MRYYWGNFSISQASIVFKLHSKHCYNYFTSKNCVDKSLKLTCTKIRDYGWGVGISQEE